MDLFQKVMSFLAILFIAWIIFGVIAFKEMAAKNRIMYLCKVYTENGIPDYIIVNRIKYDLTTNGEIPEEDKPYVNPWHWEQIHHLERCMTINTRK